MFSKRLFDMMLKNSVLMIGILMMIILAFQLNDKGYFDRFKSSPCLSTKSVLLKRSPYAAPRPIGRLSRSEALEKKLPENWSLSCKKNVLYADIDFIPTKTTTAKTIRKQMYAEMANNLLFISHSTKDSFDLNLSKTFYVVMKIKSDYLDIAARTRGEDLAKLSDFGITEKDKKIPGNVEGKQKLILQRLNKFVEVQEKIKKAK